MKTAKTLVLALVVVGLAACGGGISNKEDAAKVVQRLGAMGAGTTSSVTQGLTSEAFNFDMTGKSGSAKASIDVDMDVTLTSVTFGYIVDVTFNQFSPDGNNTYNGTEKVEFALNASAASGSASGSVAMKLNANVEVKGDYNSKVVADLTMTLDASVVKATSGTVSMKLNGTVTADGQTFTYDNETLSVTASK